MGIYYKSSNFIFRDLECISKNLKPAQILMTNHEKIGLMCTKYTLLYYITSLISSSMQAIEILQVVLDSQ